MKPHHHKKRIVRKGLAHHITLSTHYQLFFDKRVRAVIDSCLLAYSKRFGIKLYHRALVGNHLHLVLLTPSENDLSSFLRVLSGQIAYKLRKIKLVPEHCKNFWRSRPWSRVLQWGKDYSTAIKYVALNYLEGTKQIIRRRKVSDIKRFEALIAEVLQKQLTSLAV